MTTPPALRLRRSESKPNLLDPVFRFEEGTLVLDGEPLGSRRREFPTATAFEVFATHVHVLEYAEHAIPTVRDRKYGTLRPDHSHPHFERAWNLAGSIASAWSAALARQFPEREFRVYATKFDDPCVRCHLVRRDESAWLSDELAAEAQLRGELVMLAVGALRAS